MSGNRVDVGTASGAILKSAKTREALLGNLEQGFSTLVSRATFPLREVKSSGYLVSISFPGELIL